MIPRPGPFWPERVIALHRALEAGGGDAARDALWVLLHGALLVQLRRVSRGVPEDELHDLAAEKALELTALARKGRWRVGDRAPAEVAGYLLTVARNAVVDRFRDRAREEAAAPLGSGPRDEPPADRDAQAGEFAAALRECAARLRPVWRRAWLLRAFLDLPSREIAAHPEVRLRPGHVDVLLQRTRASLTACLEGKGFGDREVPAGAFASAWRALAGSGDGPEGAEEGETET